MDEAFVINLNTRKDRWKAMQESFQDSGIKLQRFSAIKKDPGAYGLVLTVMKAVRHAKKRGLPALLLLEDDCVLRAGWKERWLRIKEWLEEHPDEWDIYSGGAQAYGDDAKEVGHTGSIRFFRPKWSHGGHFIYIPARSYDLMLAKYKKCAPTTYKNPVIGADIINGHLKRLISHPFVAYQDDGHSNIETKIVKRRDQYVKTERKLGRTRRLTRKRRR